MVLQVDGQTPLRVRVNSVDVSEVRSNGTKVWPEANGDMTAGVAGGSTYGYLSSSSPNNGGSTVGSLSGDSSVYGHVVIRITWGFDLLVVEFNDEVTKSEFTIVRLETEAGEKTYHTSSSTHSAQNGYTQWTWNESSQLFLDGRSYNYLFV